MYIELNICRFAEAVSRAGGDVRQGKGGWHAAKGGDMGVDMPGQQVIQAHT